MSEIEAGAVPKSSMSGPSFLCPCGQALEEVFANISRETSEIRYRCPDGHRWQRLSLIGFSDRWTRLEGVGT